MKPLLALDNRVWMIAGALALACHFLLFIQGN